MTKPIDTFKTVARLDGYLIPGYYHYGPFFEDRRGVIQKTKTRKRGWVWVMVSNEHAAAIVTFDEQGVLQAVCMGCECGEVCVINHTNFAEKQDTTAN